MRCRLRSVLVLAGTLWVLCTGVLAQQYPAKPVRVIVPFAAGGTPDLVGRIISQQLAAQTGRVAEIVGAAGIEPQ